MIRTTFWGVRGSIPVPGPTTARIGGNTSCIEVQCADARFVFDSGTGIRLLGRRLAREPNLTLHLFFSHVHWDHIQGFPFFAPAFIPGTTIHLYGAASAWGTIENALQGQMEFPNFPVKLRELRATLVFHDLTPGDRIEPVPRVVVRTAAGRHPGGVLAYRVEHGGRSIVYATDTEHPDSGIDESLAALARGADVLIYDAMYTPDEYEGRADGMSRRGWGHSTYVAGAELARAAGVGRYVLFHHDPDQDDAAVREKEAAAKALFESSLCAYEGLVLEI